MRLAEHRKAKEDYVHEVGQSHSDGEQRTLLAYYNAKGAVMPRLMSSVEAVFGPFCQAAGVRYRGAISISAHLCKTNCSRRGSASSG